MKLLVALLVLFPQNADALTLDDPILCFLLDGVLGIYGLVVTGMLLKEKFFNKGNKTVTTGVDNQYQDADASAQKRQKRQRRNDETYMGLQDRHEEYKELEIRPNRQRRDNQIYQGLSGASRDEYEELRRKNPHSP